MSSPDHLNRSPSPSASREGVAGASIAAAACDKLELFAFIKSFEVDEGRAVAIINVDPKLLASFAPTLVESNPLFSLNSTPPRCTLFVESVNIEPLNQRYSDVLLVVDGDVPDPIEGFSHEITATRYCIDPSPSREPDPTTDLPAQNVQKIRDSWAMDGEDKFADPSPEALVRQALDVTMPERRRRAFGAPTTADLGTAAEVDEILALTDVLLGQDTGPVRF